MSALLIVSMISALFAGDFLGGFLKKDGNFREITA
jgi:hypothetical protein